MTPEERMVCKAEWRRAWRERRFAAGRCSYCVKDRLPGRRFCAEHAAAYKTRSREAKAVRRKAGVCLHCGKTRGPDGTQTLCGPCRERSRENARKWRARKKHERESE